MEDLTPPDPDASAAVGVVPESIAFAPIDISISLLVLLDADDGTDGRSLMVNKELRTPERICYTPRSEVYAWRNGCC